MPLTKKSWLPEIINQLANATGKQCDIEYLVDAIKSETTIRGKPVKNIANQIRQSIAVGQQYGLLRKGRSRYSVKLMFQPTASTLKAKRRLLNNTEVDLSRYTREADHFLCDCEACQRTLDKNINEDLSRQTRGAQSNSLQRESQNNLSYMRLPSGLIVPNPSYQLNDPRSVMDRDTSQRFRRD